MRDRRRNRVHSMRSDSATHECVRDRWCRYDHRISAVEMRSPASRQRGRFEDGDHDIGDRVGIGREVWWQDVLYGNATRLLAARRTTCDQFLLGQTLAAFDRSKSRAVQRRFET